MLVSSSVASDCLCRLRVFRRRRSGGPTKASETGPLAGEDRSTAPAKKMHNSRRTVCPRPAPSAQPGKAGGSGRYKITLSRRTRDRDIITGGFHCRWLHFDYCDIVILMNYAVCIHLRHGVQLLSSSSLDAMARKIVIESVISLWRLMPVGRSVGWWFPKRARYTSRPIGGEQQLKTLTF